MKFTRNAVAGVALLALPLLGCDNDASGASPFRYRVIFKPSVLVPDIEVR